MEENLVIEGLKFMVLGMGTVFVFLIIMIIIMNIQTMIIDKFFPEIPTKPDTTSFVTSSNKNKIAAVIGAILQHNQTKQK